MYRKRKEYYTTTRTEQERYKEMGQSKMTIEDMLRSGVSVDAIMDMVNEEVTRAQEQLKKETEAAKRAEEERAVARQELTAATVNYLVALGALEPGEVNHELVTIIEQGFAAVEEDLKDKAATLRHVRAMRDSLHMRKLAPAPKAQMLTPMPAPEVPDKEEQKIETDLNAWLQDFARSLS
jgi:hypothetical protein